jgi:triosephosphate isomerase (TIM)
MRKKIVAGNWKMNLNLNEALHLAEQINKVAPKEGLEIHLYPSALLVANVVQTSNHVVGVQNFHPETKGALTGENSLEQAVSVGVKSVLIGHSERRQMFHEDDAFLKRKVDAAIANGLPFIFCCGEPLEIREANTHNSYVVDQLKKALFHLSDLSLATIAYEPIWAIGTGRTASVEQAEEMHAEIRQAISDNYSKEIAEKVSILYGGSCNESNAKELFSCPNVDGGLIGGAALKAASFTQIIASI